MATYWLRVDEADAMVPGSTDAEIVQAPPELSTLRMPWPVQGDPSTRELNPVSHHAAHLVGQLEPTGWISEFLDHDHRFAVRGPEGRGHTGGQSVSTGDEVDSGVGRLIAQLRKERGWSQSQLADQLARVSGNPAVTRNEVSRWEQGRRQPRKYWLEWIAVVFGMSLLDLHDLARLASPSINDEEAEAIELRQRVAASDVGSRTLEQLEAKVDDLAVAYPKTAPDLLLAQIRTQLGYVGKLLDAKKTLTEHRRLVVTGSWLSLLAATCSIDLADRPIAEARLKTAAELADHAGHSELSGWCLETHAWQAVTDGEFKRAIELSQAAQAVAPHGSSAFIQATAQEGRAHSRLGNVRETLRVLSNVEHLVAPLKTPERPEHHYRYDPEKSNAYVATTLSWLGDPGAESIARQVLHRLESPAVGLPRPRRAATARLDLSLALVASGKPDEASHMTMQALTSGTLVPSNFWRAKEVIKAVAARGVPEAVELKDAYKAIEADLSAQTP